MNKRIVILLALMSFLLVGCTDIQTDVYFTYSDDLTSVETIVNFTSVYDGHIAKNRFGFDVLNLTEEQEANIDASIPGDWSTFSDEQKLERFFEATLLEAGVNVLNIEASKYVSSYYVRGEFEVLDEIHTYGDSYFVEEIDDKTIITLLDFTGNLSINEVLGFKV